MKNQPRIAYHFLILFCIGLAVPNSACGPGKPATTVSSVRDAQHLAQRAIGEEFGLIRDMLGEPSSIESVGGAGKFGATYKYQDGTLLVAVSDDKVAGVKVMPRDPQFKE